LAPSISKQVLQ